VDGSRGTPTNPCRNSNVRRSLATGPRNVTAIRLLGRQPTKMHRRSTTNATLLFGKLPATSAIDSPTRNETETNSANPNRPNATADCHFGNVKTAKKTAPSVRNLTLRPPSLQWRQEVEKISELFPYLPGTFTYSQPSANELQTILSSDFPIIAKRTPQTPLRPERIFYRFGAPFPLLTLSKAGR